MTDPERKVVLVTGANTGLGFQIVSALLRSPAPYRIFLGSRSVPNGDAARARLESLHPRSASTLAVVQCDLNSDSSLGAAVAAVESDAGRLDVLLNNGGGGFDAKADDGSLSLRDAFNRSWDTNVSGTHVLTTLCVPLLLRSADPRLVFVTSGTSSLAETERFDTRALARLNATPPAKGWPKEPGPLSVTAYRSAKTGLNMLMREWARILKGDGVKVWAVSPGFLATGLGGVGEERLKAMGALDPAVGAEFTVKVVEGGYDDLVGKVIRSDAVQPW